MQNVYIDHESNCIFYPLGGLESLKILPTFHSTLFVTTHDLLNTSGREHSIVSILTQNKTKVHKKRQKKQRLPKETLGFATLKHQANFLWLKLYFCFLPKLES